MGTKVRFGGAAFAAVTVLLLLLAGAATAGGKKNEPPQPPQVSPSAAGLLSANYEMPGSHTGSSKTKATTTATTTGKTRTQAPAGASGQGAPGAVGSSTLVLYDTTGTYGWLGELYAQYAANLASHFGSWHAEPVTTYQAGQIGQYTATIYIGSTYDEPVPTSFLDDVYNAQRPVIWIYDNIWQLTNRYPSFVQQYGWMWSQFDTSTVSHVDYQGTLLSRDGADNGGGIMNYSSIDTTRVSVLADAVRDADGSTFPWAVQSGNLTYIGENPFVYTSETDRVIAFEDMLYSVLDPGAPTQHRAMLRLEDLSPTDDPAQLENFADYLSSQHIPFGFELSPQYVDPTGYYNNGTPESVTLKKGSDVAKAIQYLEAHGGTLVDHGLTHQYSNVPNPFTAVSGDDAEFYRLIRNADNTLTYQGPVAEDSAKWAGNRINQSQSLFKSAGIGTSSIWTFPDYVASPTDYAAVAQRFPTRWERGLYFGGKFSGTPTDYTHIIGQTFPYVVRDVYGTTVMPENLGDYSPDSFYGFPPHLVSDILAAGQANLAVRDGFASFFYHPYLGLDTLKTIVSGLEAQGWTFVDPATVATNG